MLPLTYCGLERRLLSFLYIYRVSNQYGNTFNFNFLILYQCYCKSKTSSVKLRFEPSRGHLDFDFFQKIRLVFRISEKQKKTDFFWRHAPNPFFSWNFVSSSNPCTRVHESEKTKSWDVLKKRGWHGAKKKFIFVSFFADPKNNLIF